MTVPEDKRAAAAQGMLHAWWAARIPDRLALVTPQGDRTYDDLNAEINRLSRALRARGLQPGDAIALMCTNRPEFLEVLYAAQRIGLRLTPINWHLTGEEAAYIVENCEAKAFVCSGELGDKVAVAAAAGGPGLVRINTGGYLPGFEMYNTVVAAEEGSDIDDPVIGTQMLYTSGTTGRPKGVHRETAAVSALATVNFCGYDEDYENSVDAHLLTGPLYHAAPLAFSVAVPLPLRRAHRRHGPLGPRRGAAPDRAPRDHAHPHGPHHVPPPAGAAPRGRGSASTPRRSAS